MTTQHDALAGLRVLDLGIITAGAATSAVLADFGADVVKIESATYLDPFRDWSQIAGGGSPDINASPPFATANRGKRSVAINLKSDAGRAAFLELVRVSDIVVENFRRGVLDRLGIGFDVLCSVNPRIVLVSLSSQGSVGPEAGYASFGSTLEAIGGLMAITGYGDGSAPTWTGNNVNYPDQLVSVVTPGIILAALRARNRTGEAVHVDAPQREAVTAGVGETIIDYSLTGTVAEPRGNGHSRFVPHGVYPADGVDRWIALCVENDEQWRSVVRVLGLAASDEWSTADRRRSHEEAIAAAIARATRDRDATETAEALQAAGVGASAVCRPREVLQNPQLAALGFHVRVPGDDIVQRGFVSRLDHTPGRVRSRAPRLGEHTHDVLADILDFDDDRIRDLRDTGAIFCDSR